eukprot:4851410-Amphidinium_carterae.1
MEYVQWKPKFERQSCSVKTTPQPPFTPGKLNNFDKNTKRARQLTNNNDFRHMGCMFKSAHHDVDQSCFTTRTVLNMTCPHINLRVTTSYNIVLFQKFVLRTNLAAEVNYGVVDVVYKLRWLSRVGGCHNLS